jgi:parallel beta-helix repeat protein
VADGFVWIDDEASPLFEGNVINNVIRNAGDSDARIVGNRVGGVWAEGGAAPTIEDNLIDFANNGGADGGFSSCGVEISGLASPTVASNVIHNAPTGICVLGPGSTSATIEGNELLDNAMGIRSSRSDVLIKGNHIEGGSRGILISTGSPSLIDNIVVGVSRQGITIAGAGSPTLSGNHSCDNGTNLTIIEGATPEIDDTNVFRGQGCPPYEDSPVEPSE